MNKTRTSVKRIVLWIVAISFITFGVVVSGNNMAKLFNGNKGSKSTVEVEPEVGNTEDVIDDSSELLYPTRPEKGENIGTLYIPKLDEELPIIHGTDEDELSRGVGHYAGSVLPGEKDNSVLSGHRDTVFRRLGEVKEGDELIVTTAEGTFTYKIRKVRIVDADDRTVIVPKPKATLTVTTCYPFTFIGAAPERYVLVADLVKKERS
ncbi:class D sortase [Pseudalkalibacillus sp. Hm43]|uniref:class D sortase n=1 Tax=Pseudalkalibacillus sp. Hm43 TaxID=3450742 RepID=UPI003F4356D2